MPRRVTRANSGLAARPSRRRRFDPLAAVLVAAGIGGLAVGEALRPEPVPPPPGADVLATVNVTDVIFDPDLVALLDVGVYNGGGFPVRVQEVSVITPGLPAVAAPAEVVVEPDDVAVLHARADLVCGRVPVMQGAVAVTVSLARADADADADAGGPGTTVSTVMAVQGGAQADLPACIGADLELGWTADIPRATGRLISSPAGEQIRADGLPPGSVVDGVIARLDDRKWAYVRLMDRTQFAAGWWLGLEQPVTVGPDGAATLPLTTAAISCGLSLRDWRVLPTGVTLTFADSIGAAAYVSVGPELARWAVKSHEAACS